MATIVIITNDNYSPSETVEIPVKNMTQGEAWINAYVESVVEHGMMGLPLTGGQLGDWKNITLYYGPNYKQTLTYEK